jgi:hypothetical protein
MLADGDGKGDREGWGDAEGRGADIGINGSTAAARIDVVLARGGGGGSTGMVRDDNDESAREGVCSRGDKAAESD